jgi:hypothetical protein
MTHDPYWWGYSISSPQNDAVIFTSNNAIIATPTFTTSGSYYYTGNTIGRDSPPELPPDIGVREPRKPYNNSPAGVIELELPYARQ